MAVSFFPTGLPTCTPNSVATHIHAEHRCFRHREIPLFREGMKAEFPPSPERRPVVTTLNLGQRWCLPTEARSFDRIVAPH